MAITAKEKNHWHENRPASQAILDIVSGRKIFADDVNVPRQVYVRPIFAKNVGARITKVDFSRALENVRFGDCILKADIPGSFDGMIGVGDTVENNNQVAALLVSTYLAELDALARLIDIEYDAVTDSADRGTPEMPECAAALNIPEEDIKIVATPVPGCKSGRAEVFAALVAWLTQQSAKVKF